MTAGERLCYDVTFDHRSLLKQSPFGLVFQNGPGAGERATVSGIERRQIDTVRSNPFGKRSSVRDRFDEIRLHLRFGNASPGNAPAGTTFDPVVRAYDDGVAFRYELPVSTGAFTVTGEKTGFTFAEDAPAWGGEWSNCGECRYPATTLALLPASKMCLPLLVRTRGATVARA